MKRQGSALLMISTLATLLMLVAMLSTITAVSDTNVTHEDKIKTKLELAAESGIRRAKAKINLSFENPNLTKLEPNILFQGTDEDDTTSDPAEKAFDDTESFYSGGAGSDYYSYNITSNDNTPDITVKYSIKRANLTGNGWTRDSKFTKYNMEIESVASAPGYGWVGLKENATAKRTTLFMYQIFYENDLEILPGPTFNLKGLVHTNGNLYLNSNDNNFLNIYTDSLTTFGNVTRGRLDRNEITGTVRITKGSKDGDLVSMTSGEGSTNNNWMSNAINKWNGTLKDKKLGAERLEAPKLGSFQPGGFYDQQAGLNIKVITASGTPQYKISYNGSSHTYTSAQLNNALTETQIYDYREYPSKTDPTKNTPIKLTNVDINKLKTALGYYPSNGLIYMTRDDAVADLDRNDFTPDSRRVVSGFKLVNSSTLPAATTFVSNLPTYIQGNFNVHSSTDPNVDTWKPSAIIADAINLLSNDWRDNYNWKDPRVNSGTPMPKAAASGGEYNTVFITGNLPTKSGQYNGGLENFPRFLEDWSSRTCKTSGGFIQLFRSQYATGLWGSAYYSPPNRNWSSESRFSDLRSLPPGFADLFPSTSIGIVYSNWSPISKQEADIE